MNPNLEHGKALAAILEEILVKGYRKEVDVATVAGLIQEARAGLNGITIPDGGKQTEWVVSDTLRYLHRAEEMKEAGELLSAIGVVFKVVFRFMRDFEKLGNLK